jgi:hypothetical protein
MSLVHRNAHQVRTPLNDAPVGHVEGDARHRSLVDERDIEAAFAVEQSSEVDRVLIIDLSDRIRRLRTPFGRLCAIASLVVSGLRGLIFHSEKYTRIMHDTTFHLWEIPEDAL